MKKKILSMTVLAIIGLTNVSSSDLLAFDTPLGGGKWWYRPAVKDKLQLTPDQINKISKVWIEHRKRIIDIRGNIEKAYLDLESIMSQPVVDTQVAYTLAERLGQLQARRTEERIRMVIEIRRELSIEQFEKLRGLRREFARRFREKGARGEKRRRDLP